MAKPTASPDQHIFNAAANYNQNHHAERTALTSVNGNFKQRQPAMSVHCLTDNDQIHQTHFTYHEKDCGLA